MAKLKTKNKYQTLHDFFSYRAGILLVNNITDENLYKAYCKFTQERGNQPCSWDEAWVPIHNYIRGIRYFYQCSTYEMMIETSI